MLQVSLIRSLYLSLSSSLQFPLYTFQTLSASQSLSLSLRGFLQSANLIFVSMAKQSFSRCFRVIAISAILASQAVAFTDPPHDLLASDAFSVRIVSVDYYMAPPIPGLDVSYSSFQGVTIFICAMHSAAPARER